MACKHESTYYYPSVNDDGWRCVDCDTEFGKNEGIDKKLIYTKVRGLLHDLHEAKLIYVSNGTDGDCITSIVCDSFQKDNDFSQGYIIYQIAKFLHERD